MRILLYLILLAGISPNIAFCQQTKTSECTMFNVIIKQMLEWKESQTTPNTAVGSKIQKPKLTHTFLQTRTASYYSSRVRLPEEYASEFGIDSLGKCSYTAYFGPYSSEDIEKKGDKLKKDFLSCINLQDWTISKVDEAFLQVSYKPIDISVTIVKSPAQKKGHYYLVLTIFRFTPVQ